MIFRFLFPAWFLIFLSLVLTTLIIVGFWRANRGERRLWIRRALLALCVIALGLAPSRPSEISKETTNLEVYFVVDRTGSMSALDWGDAEPRLKGVSQDIIAATKTWADGRFSIISFTDTSQVELPLTTDTGAVQSWAQTIAPERTSTSQGSSLATAYSAMSSALLKSKQNHPNNIRIVVFMSDGEDTASPSTRTTVSWPALKSTIDGGLVLGYGTTQGARMRRFDGPTSDPKQQVPFIIDSATGQPAISKANPQALQSLAQNLGIGFQMRTANAPLGDLLKQVSAAAKAKSVQDQRQNVAIYRDFVWPIIWVMVGLLAWELYYLMNRFRRIRRTHG